MSEPTPEPIPASLVADAESLSLTTTGATRALARLVATLAEQVAALSVNQDDEPDVSPNPNPEAPAPETEETP